MKCVDFKIYTIFKLLFFMFLFHPIKVGCLVSSSSLNKQKSEAELQKEFKYLTWKNSWNNNKFTENKYMEV